MSRTKIFKMNGDTVRVVVRRPKKKLIVRGRINRFSQEITDDDNVHLVRDLLKKTSFKNNVKVLLIGRSQGKNRVLKEEVYDLPSGSVNSWWNDSSKFHDWIFDSDTTLFTYYSGLGKILPKVVYDKLWILITRAEDLVPRNIVQKFKEGKTNCCLTPISDFFKRSLDNAKSKKKKSVFRTKIEDTGRLAIKYKDGVPQDELQNVTNILNVNINMMDVAENTFVSTKVKGKQYTTFNFINSKINHCDLYTNASHNNKIEVDDLEEIKEELDESGEFYTYTQTQVHTLDRMYSLIGYRKEIEKWENEQKLDSFEYFVNPELSEFVKKACHYGACLDYESDVDILTNATYEKSKLDYIKINNLIIKHVDHKKSYYNFKSCHLYEQHKFPHAPSIYSQLPDDFDYKKYPGCYLIDDINFDDVRDDVKHHLKKLNIYSERDIYTVPELVYMEEIGIKFNTKIGAFCHTSRDIDMTFLLEGDEYKKWATKQTMIRLDKVIKLKGSKELAEQLTYSYGADRVKFYEPLNEITLATRKKKCYHRSHIAAYVLSYSRIQILEQLFKIPYENVIRIQLDGIYFQDCEYEHVNSFQDKPVDRSKLNKNNNCGKYISSYNGRKWNPPKFDESYKHRIVVFGGAGGSGKTFYALTNPAYSDPIFTAPSHLLLDDKFKEHNLENYCTHSRLKGNGRPPYGQTHVIIVDECTMLSKKDMSIIINKYKNSHILFCGDVCLHNNKTVIFQLPAYKGEPIDISSYYFKHFTENYRCKDEKLKEILDVMRLCILLDRPLSYINNKLKLLLKDRWGDLEDYNVDDYVLAGTKKMIYAYTQMLEHHPKKWLVTRTTKDFNTGCIYVQKEQPTKNAELRHAFTVHATQGRTIKSKLFIDTNKLFDPRMAYTALSRAEYLDQIYII